MVKCDVRKIDEVGRIHLPSNLSVMTLIEKGDKVNLQPVGNLVILHMMTENPEEGYRDIKIDELNRVIIPKELLEKMGWKLRDKINTYYVSEDMLAFELV